MRYRNVRVAGLIQEELGKIILRELNFGDALVTITGVQVDEELETAAVKLGVVPQSAAAKALSLAAKEAGRLQYLLTRKINIKPMPRLVFEIDYGAESAARVEKLLLGEDNNEEDRAW